MHSVKINILTLFLTYSITSNISSIEPSQLQPVEASQSQALDYIQASATAAAIAIGGYCFYKQFIKPRISPNSLRTMNERYSSNEEDIEKNIKSHYNFKHIENMLNRAYEKQKEELKKGNYLFYHARCSEWEFIADIYKQSYNLINKKKAGKEYVFLKFGEDSQLKSANLLWMNGALYANASNTTSCSIWFVLENTSLNKPDVQRILKTTFNQLGLAAHYTKYGCELLMLEYLFANSNPNNIGNLLGISIPAKKLYYVKSPYGVNEAHMKKIITSEIIHDSDVFVLPLTSDYALDPHKGPRIYSFNAVNHEKYRQYELYRDQLFSKIAKELHSH